MAQGPNEDLTELTPSMKELSVVRTKSAPVTMSKRGEPRRATVPQSSDESEEDNSERKPSGDTSSEVSIFI